MKKMHFFTDDKATHSYDCFGWWLSDLVDVRKAERIPKTDISVGVTCGQELRVDSEGSVPPGHQQNKTDVGQITFDLTDNTTGRPQKISTASNTSARCVSDLRTRLQNYWISPVEDDDTGLSPVVKLALSIEHDPDRILEDSRSTLMQAFRDLDSRVRGLQEGARQLQADVNRLQKDFEVCGSLHIK